MTEPKVTVEQLELLRALFQREHDDLEVMAVTTVGLSAKGERCLAWATAGLALLDSHAQLTAERDALRAELDKLSRGFVALNGIAALEEMARLRSSIAAISDAADRCVDDIAHGTPNRFALRELRVAIDGALAARAKAEKGGG